MDTFFLTTAFIPRVCFVILYTVLVGYLLSLKRKAPATWWLIAFCCTFCIIDLGWDLFYVIPATQMDGSTMHLVFVMGQGLFIPSGLTFLQFAYTFRGNPYPREAKGMLAATGTLAVIAFLLILLTPSYLFSPLLPMMQVGALLVFILLVLWSGVVFLRKAYHSSKEATIASEVPAVQETGWWVHLRNPQGRPARACRAFGYLSALMMVVTIGGMLVWGLGILQDLGAELYWTGYVLFLYMLLVVYVNYSPEPTTVQVKLVGMALATLLLFVVVLTRTLFSDAVMLPESGIKTPAPQTLRFSPEEAGGYVVTAHPSRFEAAVGSPIASVKGVQQAVPLAFEFPYYGAVWDSLYISENGLVSVGGAVEKGLDLLTLWPVFHTWPVIVPLGIDLDATEGGGVFFLASADSAVVTWLDLPLANGVDRHTAQLVLYPTGGITFHYGAPGQGAVAVRLEQLGARGLFPGGKPALVQELPRILEGPVQSTAGAALIEDYATQYYRYQSSRGRPFLVLIVLASLFILFVFPVLFRRSLIKPLGRLLEGVERIERGAMDTVVAVEVEDEIGTLTQHFNHMAFTIRQAERQLKDYADTLEHKVEVRTAELVQSLDDLKRTQARLVQAEKMASLGQLTAGIAHEIKNPLNFVNNFAQLAVELADDIQAELEAGNGHLGADRRANLEELLDDLKLNVTKIEKHGRRADGIVRSMMQHASGGTGERQEMEINLLVSEHLELAYHGRRAQVSGFKVEIERDLSGEAGTVEMVPQEIGRVLLNLFSNAFDAVYEQAATTKGETYEPTVSVSTRRVGGQVEIRVADNGPGISSEIREKIFEPFYTTKPTGTGTGLGLSLSYDIVTQGHGGALSVESIKGEGATFIITLPAESAPPALST